MSTYQLFIVLHGLKDVLVWLVPLLIAVLFSVTAFVISSRWIRERRTRSASLAELLARVEGIETRIANLETTDAGSESIRSQGTD